MALPLGMSVDLTSDWEAIMKKILLAVSADDHV